MSELAAHIKQEDLSEERLYDTLRSVVRSEILQCLLQAHHGTSPEGGPNVYIATSEQMSMADTDPDEAIHEVSYAKYNREYPLIRVTRPTSAVFDCTSEQESGAARCTLLLNCTLGSDTGYVRGEDVLSDIEPKIKCVLAWPFNIEQMPEAQLAVHDIIHSQSESKSFKDSCQTFVDEMHAFHVRHPRRTKPQTRESLIQEYMIEEGGFPQKVRNELANRMGRDMASKVDVITLDDEQWERAISTGLIYLVPESE